MQQLIVAAKQYVLMPRQKKYEVHVHVYFVRHPSTRRKTKRLGMARIDLAICTQVSRKRTRHSYAKIPRTLILCLYIRTVFLPPSCSGVRTAVDAGRTTSTPRRRFSADNGMAPMDVPDDLTGSHAGRRTCALPSPTPQCVSLRRDMRHSIQLIYVNAHKLTTAVTNF